MDELILKVVSGAATRNEEERLKKWRSEAEANEARFQALVRIWDIYEPQSPQPTDLPEVESLAASILSEAERRRTDQSRRKSSKKALGGARVLTRRLAPWGAALAAGLAALSLGIRSFGNGSSEALPLQTPLSIGLSSQTLRLDDGSFVRLAPGSSLEASLGTTLREVTLIGRAFFAVAPDPTRPFVVRTQESRIRVLGTRFEVSEEADGVRAVVVEGRISLSNPDGRVEVPAGSVGLAGPGRPPGSESVEDVHSLLNWPGGLLVFHDTPLQAVSREVERHFGIPIRLVGQEEGGPRVSASFEEGESFPEIMETLCTVTRIQCLITPDSAVIREEDGGGQ